MIKLRELIERLRAVEAAHGDNVGVYLTVDETTGTLARVLQVDLGPKKLSFDSDVRVAVELTTELIDP